MLLLTLLRNQPCLPTSFHLTPRAEFPLASQERRAPVRILPVFVPGSVQIPLRSADVEPPPDPAQRAPPLQPHRPYPARDLHLLGAAVEEVFKGEAEIPHDRGVLLHRSSSSQPSEGQGQLRAILSKELCRSEQRWAEGGHHARIRGLGGSLGVSSSWKLSALNLPPRNLLLPGTTFPLQLKSFPPGAFLSCSRLYGSLANPTPLFAANPRRKGAQRSLGRADGLNTRPSGLSPAWDRGKSGSNLQAAGDQQPQRDLRVAGAGKHLLKLKAQRWWWPQPHTEGEPGPPPGAPHLPAKGLSPPKNSLKTLSGLL